jgi:hypothetical protein
MATSKTIAALLGPTLIASAASIFLNLDAGPGMIDQAFHNPALVFVSGYPLFVAGLAIVYFHNQWKGGWRFARRLVCFFADVVRRGVWRRESA